MLKSHLASYASREYRVQGSQGWCSEKQLAERRICFHIASRSLRKGIHTKAAYPIKRPLRLARARMDLNHERTQELCMAHGTLVKTRFENKNEHGIKMPAKTGSKSVSKMGSKMRVRKRGPKPVRKWDLTWCRKWNRKTGRKLYHSCRKPPTNNCFSCGQRTGTKKKNEK